jgi:hypothetical protein
MPNVTIIHLLAKCVQQIPGSGNAFIVATSVEREEAQDGEEFDLCSNVVVHGLQTISQLNEFWMSIGTSLPEHDTVNNVQNTRM